MLFDFDNALFSKPYLRMAYICKRLFHPSYLEVYQPLKIIFHFETLDTFRDRD